MDEGFGPVEVFAANVRGGETLANQLRAAGEFPPLLVNMAAVGEESGRLDAVLVEAADAYDKEVNTAIARLNALLPPLLIILVGAVVALALAAVVLPIVDAQAGLQFR